MTRKQLIEPRYTQSQVLAATRLSEKTLQNYIAREQFEMYSDFANRPGRGQRRFYSASDVVLLAAMRDLSLYSIPPSVMGNYANSVRAWLLTDGSRSQSAVGDAISGLPNRYFLFVPPPEADIALAANSWEDLGALAEEWGYNAYIILNGKQLVARTIHSLQLRDQWPAESEAE